MIIRSNLIKSGKEIIKDCIFLDQPAASRVCSSPQLLQPARFKQQQNIQSYRINLPNGLLNDYFPSSIQKHRSFVEGSLQAIHSPRLCGSQRHLHYYHVLYSTPSLWLPGVDHQSLYFYVSDLGRWPYRKPESPILLTSNGNLGKYSCIKLQLSSMDCSTFMSGSNTWMEPTRLQEE